MSEYVWSHNICFRWYLIRVGAKLNRQIVGIPMVTHFAPLVADLFLFCSERDFMASLSNNKEIEIILAFYSNLYL